MATVRKELESLFSISFRPVLREVFIIYGVTVISPGGCGKFAKTSVAEVLMLLLETLTPEIYRRQLKNATYLTLKDHVEKLSIHSLLVNPPVDGALILNSSVYMHVFRHLSPITLS